LVSGSQLFRPQVPMVKGYEERLAWLAGAPAALVAGAAARVWFYLLNDSFWRDESMLLLNVAHKSFGGLLGPLDFAQEAPVPLLWFYRLLFLSGAGGELAMRVLSLAAGILALVLFYRLARGVLPERGSVLFATWLLALAPGAILVAAQAKPYSLDLLVAVGLLSLAAPRFMQGPARPGAARLAAAAALAPWFSLPAIFVDAGIGAGLLLQARSRGLRPALLFLAAVVLSFALEFFLVLRRCLGMQQFIQEWFLHFSWNSFTWAFSQTFFAYLGPQGHFWSLALWAVAGLAAVGILEAGRRDGWPWTAVLLLPLGLALGAAAVRIYPLFGRLLLFATPGLYLLAGYGTAWFSRLIPRPRLLAATLTILALPCLMGFITTLSRPVAGVREALAFVAAEQQPGDLVLADSYALPTLAYYRLLGRPEALALKCDLKVEDWSWGRVDPWQLKPEGLWARVPPGAGVWLVAETLDYARAGVREALPYWRSLTERFQAERREVAGYVTDRVQVRGFAPLARD